jgi:hypothetical protein
MELLERLAEKVKPGVGALAIRVLRAGSYILGY